MSVDLKYIIFTDETHFIFNRFVIHKILAYEKKHFSKIQEIIKEMLQHQLEEIDIVNCYFHQKRIYMFYYKNI